MKRIFLILSVLVMLATAAFAVSEAELNRDIQVELVQTNPSVIVDDTEFTAYLVFSNSGTQTHTISFSIVSSSIFSHIGGIVDYRDLRIEPGESVNHEIRVYAKELVLADNPLKLGIREDDASTVKTVFITGTLEKKYIDITMTDPQMVADDEMEFNLTLTPSEEFYNVHLDFGLSGLPMMIANDDNLKIIPLLREKTDIPITLVFDDSATSQIYQIDVTTTANDASSNGYSTETRLALKLEFPEKVALGKLTSTPQTLRRDTKNNLINVEIANMGNDRIENLQASFVIDNEGFTPTFFGSESDFLGTIDPKERKGALFKLDIDDSVESGIYDALIELTYYHLGDEKSKSLPIEVSVQKLPYFIVNQTSTEKDENDYVSFSVTNIGDECDSVEITGLTKNLPISWRQNSDKAAKLGEDETKEFRLQLTFNELATTKEYGIPVRIRCVYNQEPVTQEEEIYVQSKGREENILPFALIGGFIILLFFLVGKYFFIPKKQG
ncbi:MAG: hypothetical protein ABIH29_04000 [Candidatus Micrarchaeota archaeon]